MIKRIKRHCRYYIKFLSPVHIVKTKQRCPADLKDELRFSVVLKHLTVSLPTPTHQKPIILLRYDRPL